jgi:hypothetical protein
MQYTLELFGGKEFIISHEEFEAVSKATGNILLSRIGVLVNPSSISCISPIEISLKRVDRQKQQVGVTPNGDAVEKRYGIWYYMKSNNPEHYDDDDVCVLRYRDYPLLPTPEEYNAVFKNIDEREWQTLLTDSDEYQRQALDSRSSVHGLTKIGDKTNTKHVASDGWCKEHQCEESDCDYMHNGVVYPQLY